MDAIKFRPQRPALRLLPLVAALAAASGAWAQADREAQVVEITAQKRTEKAKDVPLAVTAISGAALEDRGIEAASDLTGVVPNLHMTQAPVSSLIAAVGMRGIASGQPSIWADPAVGMYVDGVFVGKNMGSLFDVVDIARLEALRGPQGTLFGRNTLAGAMNFVTRKPSGLFGGSASVEVGNYDRLVGRLSVDLPKMGPLSASVALRSERQDGTIDNPSTGEAWGSRGRDAGRVALRLEPSRNVTIDYALDITDIDETLPAGVLKSSRGYGSLYPPTTQIGGTTFAFQNPTCLQTVEGVCRFPSPGIGPALRAGNFESTAYPDSVASTASQGRNYQTLQLTGHTLIAEAKLGATTTLRYIGSLRDMDFADNGDYDGTPIHVFSGARDTHYETQSHELQLVGGAGGLRYVAGLYYFKDEGTTLQRQSGGLLTFHPNVASYQMANFEIGTDAKAVYGQVDMDLGALSLGIGGRYTEEDKQVYSWRYRTNAQYVQQGANTVDLRGDQRFSKFTPTVNLLYRLTPDHNLFARVAKGFKSGGFPAEAPVTGSSAPNQAFQPESSTAYELGFKGSVLGGKGQYSANLFLMDVKDYQLSLLPAGSISPTIVNAGKVRTQGLELDASLALSRDLRMNLAYGYLEGEFKEYKALSATNQPVDAASNSVLAGAPKHTFSLSLDARLATIGQGMPLRGLFDLRHVSERYTYPGQISATAPNATVGNSADESLMPALTTVDLKLILSGIKLGGPGEGELALFVKNATNQRKPVAHMDISGFYQVHFFSDPRMYGASLTYRW